jgi:hypothetical protein
MHLWPLDLGGALLTASTCLAGLGFGLVIAPITTSALNAAPGAQAGSASAVITVLRMVGMSVGLAALSAWGLATFKALVARDSLSMLQGNAALAAHLVTVAEHEVLTDVFAIAAALCLTAIVPALALWRRSPGAAANGAEDRSTYESYVAPLV